MPGLTQQDKLINYASVFVYNPKLRQEFKDYLPSVSTFENSQIFPQGTASKFQDFIRMSDEQQRLALEAKDKAEDNIRLFFEIVKKVQGDAKLVTFALLMIDGILEEKRSRI